MMDLLVQYTQHGAIQPLTDSVWSSLPTGGTVEELKYIDHVTSICLYLFLVTLDCLCVYVCVHSLVTLAQCHTCHLISASTCLSSPPPKSIFGKL